LQPRLRSRDWDGLELMAEGRSNQGIVDALVVSPAAVGEHVTSIFAKLGLRAETGGLRRVLAAPAFLRA
jgi:DNA-binding NarL/FixJ family response regulator